ncbi:hypothetical protein BDR06DRAFT_246515 [Suillus hirtellus]|nr:hypothetical protein BDR06DRAFT_246515 [Suillus hirtellus]
MLYNASSFTIGTETSTSSQFKLRGNNPTNSISKTFERWKISSTSHQPRWRSDALRTTRTGHQHGPAASEPEILDKVKEIAKVQKIAFPSCFDTTSSRISRPPPEKRSGFQTLPRAVACSRFFVFLKLLPITKLHGKGFFDVWRQCALIAQTTPSRCAY